MGIRKSYGKNKKMGRHDLRAKAQHDEMVRKVPKRGGGTRRAPRRGSPAA